MERELPSSQARLLHGNHVHVTDLYQVVVGVVVVDLFVDAAAQWSGGTCRVPDSIEPTPNKQTT